MTSQVLGLIVLTCAVSYDNLISPVRPFFSQSDCPSVTVDCSDDMDKSVVVFKAKLSEGKVPHQNLTYKWTVYGGEIKEGQGTSSVTITNFNLRHKSLTVVLEVGGLPEACSRKASCTISV